MNHYEDGIMMSNYLDPIAKAWGQEPPVMAYGVKDSAKAGKGKDKKKKRVTKAKTFLLV